MRSFYVTRHGQVGDDSCIFPPTGEVNLTPLGEQQAVCLGRFLQSIGFHGTILASPLYRGLRTGELIAAQLAHVTLKVEPAMQEFSPPKNEGDSFETVRYGMTPQQMKTFFPAAFVPESLPDAWRVHNENDEQRHLRLRTLIDDVLQNSSDDVLFIGHGASVASLRFAMEKHGAAKIPFRIWNCSLLAYRLNEQGSVEEILDRTLDYMPPEMMTNNFGKPFIPHPDDPRYPS